MEGNRAALHELVEAFHGEIFRMVYYRTRSIMDAEDLTQDIFLVAMRNLSKLREPSRFRAWLYSIAVNRVRDHFRKRKLWSIFRSPLEDEGGKVEDEQPDPGPGPLDRLIHREFWQMVESFSHKLSFWEREIFFLRFLDQLNIREISEAVSKSESAVKTHLYRAVRKFQNDDSLTALFQENAP
jgi:RNA polymerase sigma-70 factor (ECF subfamily)